VSLSTTISVADALKRGIPTVGLFKRKEKGPAQSAPKHAVIIGYSLSDEQHGTVEEREAIFALEDRLAALIDAQKLGEHDGNEFGGGEAAIYGYGPDAGRLFAGIESELRAFPARPASAYLRYGDVSDPDAREQRIDL
jgi:hypothetical protein